MGSVSCSQNLKFYKRLKRLVLLCLFIVFLVFAKTSVDLYRAENSRIQQIKNTTTEIQAKVIDLNKCFYNGSFSKDIDAACIKDLKNLRLKLKTLPGTDSFEFLRIWSITVNYLDAKYYDPNFDRICQKVNSFTQNDIPCNNGTELYNGLRNIYRESSKILVNE
jgi:hypothetical protein